MLEKIKTTQILTALALLLTQCSTDQENSRFFDAFYKDAENKFADCLDFALHRYNQPLDAGACDTSLISDTAKRLVANGVDSDNNIMSASLTATGFPSETFCGYTKKFIGHMDKPLFDKTIYDLVSRIDTAVLIKNDSLFYSVDIRKTTMYFSGKNRYFEAKMTIKIPQNIQMEKIERFDAYHRGKVGALLQALRGKNN